MFKALTSVKCDTKYQRQVSTAHTSPTCIIKQKWMDVPITLFGKITFAYLYVCFAYQIWTKYKVM